MSFPTEQQVYHRLRWDPRFDMRRCHVVITLRPTGTKRLPLLELDTSVVPWHRIVEYWLDDELAWSRPARIDRLDELAARAAPATSAARPALEQLASVPHRWDGHAWVPGVVEGTGRGALRVVTWNLLFDRHDAGELRSEERWADALARLEAEDADVLVLVEVTPRMLALVLAQPWVRARYGASHAPDGRLLEPYGQLVLARLPITAASIVRLVRDRRAVIVHVAAGSVELGVAAVHLTSNRTEGAAALRAAQLADVLAYVLAEPRDAWILAGDFNADPGEHAALLDAAGARDAWDAVHPGEPGVTFDVEHNALAAATSTRGRSARYDRILVLGALAPTAAGLLGREVGPSGLPPSDHYGVRAELAAVRPAFAPSRRTALVLIPPEDTWGPIQRVRCAHDRGFPRWPPHVTLLYPFVEEAQLRHAIAVVDELAAATAPFDVELERVGPIDRRGRILVLSPARGTERPLAELHARLAAAFPALVEHPTYRPHLTVARDTEARELPAAIPTRWRAGTLAILHRPAERMELVHESPLAGVAPTARVPTPRARAEQARAAVRDALGPAVPVEPFGSSVYAPDHARDVDLLVRGDRAAIATLEALGLAPAGGHDRLRGTLAGLPVDLVVVPPGVRDERWLSGPADAAALVDHLARHGRHAAFLAAWPEVRRFVAARALEGNGLGWLSAFGWAMLLAVPLAHDEALCALPAAALVPAWLRWLGTLRPGAAVGFAVSEHPDVPLWLEAPAPPSRNIARTLSRGTAAHLFAELARAARARDPFAPLAVEPPPGDVVLVTGTPAQLPAYRGRFRRLLAEVDARPWAIAETPAGWEHPLSVPDGPAALPRIAAWLAAMAPESHPAVALPRQPR